MEEKAPPPEETQAPVLRHFELHRTYEQRGNSGRGTTRKHIDSPVPNRPSLVIQGRPFQHAQIHRPTQRPTQRDRDLTPSQSEINNIVLTCPENTDVNIKRKIPQRRKPLQDVYSFTSEPPTQLLCPFQFPLVCLNCKQPKDPAQRCGHCGHAPTPRPPIRLTPLPRNQAQSFYRAPPTAAPPTTAPPRVSRAQRLNDPIVLSSDEDDDEDLETGSTGSSRLDSVSPRPADSAHSSPAPSGGRVEAAVKNLGENVKSESVKTEDFRGESVKSESVKSLDESVKSLDESVRESVKSSTTTSGGAVHELNGELEFGEVDLQINIPRGHLNTKSLESLPRRARMKDQFGNDPPEPKLKKAKLPSKCSSIILECRSMRIGSLKRVVKRPVVFTTTHIQLQTEGPCGSSESITFQASQFLSCEWCSVRKLPVLFFQSSESECERLRNELSMRREGGDWLDCSSAHPDERYIVLIFENGLPMEQQVILEDILAEIGQNNNVPDFPSKISFDEANLRLVNYNKATGRNQDKASPSGTPPTPRPRPSPRPSPGPAQTRTRMSTRLKPNSDQTQNQAESESRDFREFDSDEELNDLQPTFTGPVLKLMVYPPPPATGGITVTNEDLHCLNDGEFLNDVIIDFYLKYLVLEKLKPEDSQRIHVFSSFFYKRLNQRERRTGNDSNSSLPIQKRKHNRVRTWTRHVDLFQKDFIFVPINESAHWYLAVICFPGLDAAVVEPNPDFLHQGEPRSTEETRTEEEEEEEPSSEHCRPLSPSPSPDPEEEGGEEGGGNSLGNSQSFNNELQRISVCYRDDDPFTFSDHSSNQDDASEDGADDVPNDASSSFSSSATVCRQPCILIMDSLRGPTRSTVVKTLREYLEVEWSVRRGSQRSFHKEKMRGSSPRVPQQDNFSDCGVYVLQYVESFFTKPIVSFQLPLNLSDWFPPQRMKTKREEIRDVILRLSELQQQNGKTSAGFHNEDLPQSSSEPEIQD